MSKATDRSEIVVAIELKRDAAVNSINCPAGTHPDCSNQLVCYAEGCWLARPEDHPGLTYVWLPPEAKLSDVAIETRRFSSDPDCLKRRPATRDIYDRQLDALSTKWHRATLEGLVGALYPTSPRLTLFISESGAGGT